MMNELISPTHSLQQVAIATTIEEAGIVPGDSPGLEQHQPQGQMLGADQGAIKNRGPEGKGGPNPQYFGNGSCMHNGLVDRKTTPIKSW